MITRRSLAVVLAAGSGLVLAACSDSQAENSADGPTRAGSEGGAFPATLDTAFGEITLEATPQRIVALGWGDAETALSLGVQPVGASDWLAFGGEGVGPWAEGLYDTAPTIIETLEPSYEAIAALEPDLILDVKSSGDQDRYDRLSQIATTVGVPSGGENYLTTPEQQLTMIAQALGVPDAAQALQEEVDSLFREAASAHEDWAGEDGHRGHAQLRGLGRLHRRDRARGVPSAPRLRPLAEDRGAAGFRHRILRRHLGRAAGPLRCRSHRGLPDLPRRHGDQRGPAVAADPCGR